MTIAQQLNITEFPFDIKNEEGKLIYTELSNGYWCKWEYEKDGKLIYTEDSDGYILDNRPKPEPAKKQTAVEWLEKEISTKLGTNDLLGDLYKQAKAMEKERIQDAYFDGGRDIQTNVYKGMKEYYNETYGGDK
jgi:hypothetical protein